MCICEFTCSIGAPIWKVLRQIARMKPGMCTAISCFSQKKKKKNDYDSGGSDEFVQIKIKLQKISPVLPFPLKYYLKNHVFSRGFPISSVICLYLKKTIYTFIHTHTHTSRRHMFLIWIVFVGCDVVFKYIIQVPCHYEFKGSGSIIIGSQFEAR